jgi:hypothetical protein
MAPRGPLPGIRRQRPNLDVQTPISTSLDADFSYGFSRRFTHGFPVATVKGYAAA